MQHKVIIPINVNENLKDQVKTAASVLYNNPETYSLLSPFMFGNSPYGTIELLKPNVIDKAFEKFDIRKLTDIITNLAYVLNDLSDTISKTENKELAYGQKQALAILNLAIDSKLFAGQKYHRFKLFNSKDNTCLKQLLDAKAYVKNNMPANITIKTQMTRS